MSEEPLAEFRCRIEGRAGHLRVYDDRVALVRSGWGGAGKVTEIALGNITEIAAGEPGRVFVPLRITTVTGVHVPAFPANEVERAGQVVLALVLEPAFRVLGDPGAPVVALEPLRFAETSAHSANSLIPAQVDGAGSVDGAGPAVQIVRPAPPTPVRLPAPALPAEAAAKLERLALLHFTGVLNAAEYEGLKAELIAQG
ncbi:MAG: hypothetical protein ACT4PP_00035 [Sporichthyaceae bacterium]